jgi:hypothetical protein
MSDGEELMKRQRLSLAQTRRIFASLFLLPMLTLVGCEPITTEAVQEFVVAFVRSAAAAWLL